MGRFQYLILCALSIIIISSCSNRSDVPEGRAQIESTTENKVKSGDVDWDNMEKNAVLGSYFNEETVVIHFQKKCFVDNDYPDFLLRSSLMGSNVSELSCLTEDNTHSGDYSCIMIAVPKGINTGEVEVSVHFITFGGCVVNDCGSQKAVAFIDDSDGLSVKLTLANDYRIYLAFDTVVEGSVFDNVPFGEPLPTED